MVWKGGTYKKQTAHEAFKDNNKRSHYVSGKEAKN